jgi:hypothetical protein
MKRFFATLAILAGLLSPVYAAGTVPGFSLTIQFDNFGKVAPGCKLYVIQAGTVSSPQIAYTDSALTIPAPGGSQLTCDASGRLPQFFLADGSIKFRLADRNGVTIFTQDGILVVGASSGGGGGSPVDATTILQTGDIKVRYGTGVLTGFIRGNGRTIGSATSGSTERANSDCQALFEYLWNTDPNLVVSTGRGASSIADWTANKQITLPDYRGRAIGALADMGNSASGVLQTAYFGSNPTVLGAIGGNQASILGPASLPPHTHNGSGTTGVDSPDHGHTVSGTTSTDSPDHTHAETTFAQQNSTTYAPSAGASVGAFNVSGQSTAGASARHTHTFSTFSAGANVRHQHAYSFTTDSGPGSSTAFPTVGPMLLITVYLKL